MPVATWSPAGTDIPPPPGFEVWTPEDKDIPPPPGYEYPDPTAKPTPTPTDTPQPPPDEMGWMEWAGRGAMRAARDVGVTAAKGAVGLPQAVTGLADMVPITAGIPGGGPGGPVAIAAEKAGVPLYGWSGWMQEKLGIKYDDAQQLLHEAYSPETQQAYRNVSEAKGLLGKVGAALKNPSVVLTSIGESLPQMVAGGVIGKAVGAIPTIGKYGYAIGEGLMTAGAGAEQTRAQSESGFLTQEQAAINTASGALTGAIGVLGGKVATHLGIDDIDMLLAGGASQEVKRGVIVRALAGALVEGGVEEAPQSVQEQIASNLANGKPWHEGWDESLVIGALSGAVMGGATQLRPRTQRRDDLKRLVAKGFVSEEDAKTHGIAGATRKERMANTVDEIQNIEKEIQDAQKVPEDQRVAEETGEVGQGGPADSGGDVYQGVEEQVGGGQATEAQVAPELTEADFDELRAALDEKFGPQEEAVPPDVQTPTPTTRPAQDDSYSARKKRLDEARRRGDVTMKEVEQGTEEYRGMGGIASEARGSGFQVAFRDNETGEVAIPMTEVSEG